MNMERQSWIDVSNISCISVCRRYLNGHVNSMRQTDTYTHTISWSHCSRNSVRAIIRSICRLIFAIFLYLSLGVLLFYSSPLVLCLWPLFVQHLMQKNSIKYLFYAQNWCCVCIYSFHCVSVWIYFRYSLHNKYIKVLIHAKVIWYAYTHTERHTSRQTVSIDWSLGGRLFCDRYLFSKLLVNGYVANKWRMCTMYINVLLCCCFFLSCHLQLRKFF